MKSYEIALPNNSLHVQIDKMNRLAAIIIHLMHNDVKQCFEARTCIAVVVVMNESNMASCFPEAGNLNGSNTDMCSDVAEPSSRGSGDLFELSDRSNETIIFYYFPHY